MIKKITITKESKSIPKNFELELGQLTVITGENNSGKTNFIRAVWGLKGVEFLDENGEKLEPEIVYIAAENINPSDNECKTSTKSSGLIENLSKLFSNLEVKFNLENKKNIIKDIEDLIDRTNKNLENFSGKTKHQLEIETNDEIDSSTIIQALIKSITGKEDGKERKLSELGQGTQRIIVASILKAYVDILIERKKHTEKPILVLFEEPEIYLHPKLKRTLNATLEKIAEQENHQVIVTTHDPYFVFKNFDGLEKTIFSFMKESEVTEVLPKKIISGIEDELLFIFLYSLVEEKNREFLRENLDGFKKRKYFEDGKKPCDKDDLVYIRHQIHHLGDNPFTIGLVSEEPKKDESKNFYTEEELAGAIKMMSKMLGRETNGITA
ncbi:MAG: ATP-dependent OLD family endonuclease [Candidatus Nomurabacteria bacterium GW2011_GWA2_42_41]|nr:MAG: ATP-dependent OLD family endonuclease [Candidatus Levybacteria bacterium GW2011_GWC2_37_7]KKS59242.1 MAG: ATP-dependent OLD family endonuclease [Candidatus Nomurabacteria bacterium GW2011_GWA2_42_41]